jgi:predicted DNA-binding transcriptional regulator AlpA
MLPDSNTDRVGSIDPVYSVKEAARICGGISRAQLYRLIKAGKLASPVRISAGRVGLRAADIRRFLSELDNSS